MVAAWPTAKIPHYPNNEGYAHIYGDARASSNMEQGAARLRRKHRTAKTKIAIDWSFTNVEVEIFHAFWRWSIGNGADPFTMDVFTGSQYQNLTVQVVQGSLQVKPDEGEWRVSCTMEADELPVMSSGDLTALIGSPGSGLPAWPTAYIPCNPLAPELMWKFAEGTLRSDFEDGHTQQRAPFHAAPAFTSVSFPMTQAQYDAWRAFRVHRLGYGHKWFTMPLMRGNSNETNTVRIAKNGARATRQGPDWILHLSLELRDLYPPAPSVLV